VATLIPPLFAPITFKVSSDSTQCIAKALSCGKIGGAEGVQPGKDLYRIDIDLSSYPNAVCNDGTPATIFVRRYSNRKNKNKWLIFLLGGGDCTDGQSCFERWCSINTGYGANKMSTAPEFLKEQTIGGNGIFNPDSSVNNFAGWNQVFVYYCSSDDWAGSVSNVRLSATDTKGKPVEYLINFRGADIVEAVIGTLQREPGGRPVSYKDSDGVERVMPDLDKAEIVLFAGSSAGGAGSKNNMDRVGELLRKSNKLCRGSSECPLVYLGVVDASYPPSLRTVDLTQAVFCKEAPFLCGYDALYKTEWSQLYLATWGARGDESCVNWHQTHLPGTEWMCADLRHVIDNHITTPLFVRQDLQDQNLSSKFVELGLATPAQFGPLVHDQLLNLNSLDGFAEEGSVSSGGPKLMTPGVFGPQCTQHYGLSVSLLFFQVKLTLSGKQYSFHDLLWNWVQGMQPQQAVRAFAGPGPAPDCP
jgi:hypothetical protein